MSVQRPDDARSALEERWLALIGLTLPALAIERGWPICRDHCFARVLLDNACGGRWYDFVADRPAYRCADIALLEQAVALGEAVAAGSDLAMLNQRSLGWRGKRSTKS